MIWPCNYGTRWDFYRHADTLSKLLQQDSAAQGELRARLEAAGLVPHVLVPEVGELILICAQRPHAVHGFVDGDRVSMQSFITNTGAGGAHARLLMRGIRRGTSMNMAQCTPAIVLELACRSK